MNNPQDIPSLCIPHSSGRITINSPTGPGSYVDVGRAILEKGQNVLTGDYTASLLYAAYCSEEMKNEPLLVETRRLMKEKWLWVFNMNWWTSKGVYVIQDIGSIGERLPKNSNKLDSLLEKADLEEKLIGGEEIHGVSFSKDKQVRFAPQLSYHSGLRRQERFAWDGFMVASFGKEGAEKMAEVAKLFEGNHVYSFQLTGYPTTTVSAIGLRFGIRFGFGGDGWGNGYSLGVSEYS